MAIAVSYDHCLRLVKIVSTGLVTVTDRIKFVDRLVNDPGMPRRASVLIDTTGLDTPPSGYEVDAVSSLVQLLLKRFQNRLAILTT